MGVSFLDNRKLVKEYMRFLKSQEVLSEPFKDKIGQLNNFYTPLCKKIKKIYLIKKRTIIIGLSGGQGSGKSTISKILQIVLKRGLNLETVIFSIDDFYKTYYERKKISSKISSLFLTRGVPGTHDTKLLYKCIKNLKKKKFKKIKIPVFDKSIDDRLSKDKWMIINKKPDVVIFEGWCVGVKAQKKKDLIKPINRLEKLEDVKKIWRFKVNNEIEKNYKKIFNLIDKLIFLKVPSFRYVLKWRMLQEKKLRASSKGTKVMNKKEINRFIMFYERLTKHMLKNLSKDAYSIIKIDKSHKLKSIKYN